MDMEDKISFKYDNPGQLKQLIEMLSYAIELSAVVAAVVPEDFRKLHEEVISRSRQIERQNIIDLRLLTKELIECSKKLRVFPFTYLKFDGIYQTPRIEHRFPYYYQGREGAENDLALFLDSNPLNIVNNNFRFHRIWIDRIRERRDITAAKNMLINLNEDQYQIREISAGLNPYDYTFDHYYDRTSYDGSLYAEDGLVIITGMKVKKDSQNKLIEFINKIGMKKQEP